MKKNIIVLLGALLLIGCTQTGDSSQAVSSAGSSSEEPVNSETALPEDSAVEETEQPEETEDTAVNQEMLKPGIWTAAQNEELTRYFVFYDNMTGLDLDADSGKGMTFEYKIEDNEIVFYMGTTKNEVSATMEKTDDEHIALSWSYGESETIHWALDVPEGGLTFYSSRDLSDKCLDYYEAHHEGERPEEVAWENNLDGTVTFQLFDELDDHISTSAWYVIDRFTAKGKDANTDEEIDLTEVE